MSQFQRPVLFTVAFYSGLATMAYEMVLGRALVPYFGGTIFTWGALIAVFLFGMSIGFFAGGRVADRHPHAGLIGALLGAAGVVIVATPLYVEPLSLYLLDAIEDVRLGALWASVALAFLPALLLAAVSPLAVRLALRDVAHAGGTVGTMSALNTVGSIVGTIGTSFFLVPTMGSRAIFYLLGAATFAAGVAILLGVRRRLRLRTAGIMVMCAAALSATTAQRVHAQGPVPAGRPDGVLESVESEYNNVYVIKQGRHLYMNFGYRGSQYVESIYDLQDPAALPATYTRYMTLAAVYVNSLQRSAFVGLGGGRTASYMVRSFPTLSMDVAEIDPEVIRLARKYFGVTENERMKISAQDGRIFLNRSKATYDAIFLDAYRGPFVPFHLLTKEYFELIKKRLNPGGVVAQNVEPTTMVLDSAIRTIGSVFRNVDTYEAGGNVVVIAYDGERIPEQRLRSRAAELTARYKLRYDLAELMRARKDITVQPGAKLLTDDFAPVEMLKTIKRHNERR